MEIEGSDARWALKSRFEVAFRGGIRTAESVLISVAWSSSLSQSFHHEGHEGARSQSRRKRRTRAFNFPPPRPAFARRCRPTSSPPRNSMKRVANKTCVNSVGHSQGAPRLKAAFASGLAPRDFKDASCARPGRVRKLEKRRKLLPIPSIFDSESGLIKGLSATLGRNSFLLTHIVQPLCVWYKA